MEGATRRFVAIIGVIVNAGGGPPGVSTPGMSGELVAEFLRPPARPLRGIQSRFQGAGSCPGANSSPRVVLLSEGTLEGEHMPMWSDVNGCGPR
jgi:hypothetical protein